MSHIAFTNSLLRAIAAWLLLPLVFLSVSCDGGGQIAPDFEFKPIGGDSQKLSDLRGKPVIVNFFATWCGPCMMELPELDRYIAKPLAERGLVVILVGVDEKPEAVVEFKKENDYSFLVATDPKSEIISRFTSQQAIPQTFLIRPDGTIGMHLVGYDPNELRRLKRQVENLLPAAR
jgi:thiol-disulfide isomerase/thioredoxin